MTLDSPSSRLRWARQQHAKYGTATEAARAFGWPVSTYLGHENGDRMPSRAAAKKYGARYGVRWEWILEGEGSPTAKPLMAPIVGEVREKAVGNFYSSGTVLERTELPPGSGARTVALKVRGLSMRGLAEEGWLIFFDDERSPPTRDLLNKLCVLELADGSILVRTLCAGRRRNRYDLESPTEPTMRDCRVKWAARVTWLKPR